MIDKIITFPVGLCSLGMFRGAPHFSFLTLLALGVVGWVAGVRSAEACEAGVPVGEVLEVRTTAYTHTEPGHRKYGTRNAVGSSLRHGEVRSAAADWSRFPLGTRFRIVGRSEEYVIDDYGSALVGKDTIDLYQPTSRSMNQWGVRHVEIEVLEWGSFEESLEVLVPRLGKAAHIAKMVKGIRAKAGDLAPGAPSERTPG